MTHYDYRMKGTCARFVDFDIDDGKLHNLKFEGGCNGNLKAIGRLVEGADARQIADTLRGNTCGPRSTSCADQLAQAIDTVLAAEA